MIVADASALVEVLLRTSRGLAVADQLRSHSGGIHVPHLIDFEVAQVLRRLVRNGSLEPSRGEAALEDLSDFPMERHPHRTLLPRNWQLRENLTAYDAAYVILAEALDAALISADVRTLSTVRGLVRIQSP